MKYVPNHHLDCPMFTSSSTKPSYQMTQTLPTYQRYEQLTPQMSNFSFGNNYNNTYIPPMRNPLQNYYNNVRAYNQPKAQGQSSNRSMNKSQGYSFKEEIELMDIKLKCDLLSHKLSKLNNIILPSSANTDIKRFRTRNYNFGNIVQRNGRFCITDKNENRGTSRGKSTDHEDLSDIADDIVNNLEVNEEEEKEEDGQHMKKNSVTSEKKFIEDECIEIGGIEEKETVEEIVKCKGVLKSKRRKLQINKKNEDEINIEKEQEEKNDNKDDIENENNDKEENKEKIEEKKDTLQNDNDNEEFKRDSEDNKENEEIKDNKEDENINNEDNNKEEVKVEEENKENIHEENNIDNTQEEKKENNDNIETKPNQEINTEQDNQPKEEEMNVINPTSELKDINSIKQKDIKLDLTKATLPSEEQKLNQEDDPSNPTHQKLNTDEKDDMLINQIIQNTKPTEDNVTPLVTPRDNIKENIETPTTQKKKKNVTFNDPALIKIEYSQDDLITKLDVIDSANNHLRFRPKNINRYLTLLASDTQPKPCILNSSNSKLLYSYGKSSNKKPLIVNNKNMIKKNIEMIQEIAKRGSIWKVQDQKKAKRVPQHNCRKFVQNPQKFFTEDLCETVLKSYDLKIHTSDKPRHVGRSVSPKKVNSFYFNENKKGKESSLQHSVGNQSEEMHNFKLMVDRVQIRPIEEENSEDSNIHSASKRKHSI